MRYRFFLFLLLCISASAKDVVNVGIVMDGLSPQTDRTISLIKNEIKILTKGEFDVRFPKKYQRSGEWKRQEIHASIERLYADVNVDIVLVLGYGAAVVAVNRKEYPKPTFAAMIIDEKTANAPLEGNSSGKHNLTYISISGNLKRELSAFHEVVEFEHPALLSDALVSEVMPRLSDKGKREVSGLGMKISYIRHGGESVNVLLSKIPKNVDAIMIGALSRMNMQERSKLLSGLLQRGIASYSIIDSQLVEQGALMATVPSKTTRQIARRIALDIQATLLGEDPKDMNVFINEPRRIVINMQTAERLNISPSFKVMLEAKQIHEVKPKASNHWDLKKVASEALKNNLTVWASALNTKIGKEKINESRSSLLPQISATVNHQFHGGYGSNVIGKQNGSASLGFSQIIYDEAACSGFDIETLSQRVRELEKTQVELNIVQNATIKFLDVLKAQVSRNVQKENVILSRVNLELAQSKVKIGIASKADVYRWQSSLSSAKSDLLRAEAALLQSKEALNQLLNRPLNEQFTLDLALANDPMLVMNDPRLASLFDTQRGFLQMRKTFVEKGLNSSPEIAIIGANIVVAKRTLKSQKRSYYIPRATLDGEYSNTYYDSRVAPLSEEGKDNWRVGVNVSLPLYQGGARSSKVTQANLKLKQLKWQLQDRKSSIEQQIRANLRIAQASKLSIELQQAAAKASEANYAQVYDAYSKGKAGVIDLVDAKNSKLTARLNATNAIYQFLIDMMNLQRSIGTFDFFLSDEERSTLINTLSEQ